MVIGVGPQRADPLGRHAVQARGLAALLLVPDNGEIGASLIRPLLVRLSQLATASALGMPSTRAAHT